jgi:secreted protein with Ig-like and vWFA domain
MKKDSNKIIVKTNDLGLADDVNKDFETFKSIVANAVLDYMESQSDSDLIECLEKANIFLTNISLQMENVFNNQKQSFKDQNDMLEVVDDLFSTKQQTLSNSIH